MSDSRFLVRCPNCKNLLPQPPDHPFFHCGACATLLTAESRSTKKKLFDKEMVGAVASSANNSFGKREDDQGMRREHLEGYRAVEYLEQDRLELLRKLDDLNNQLRQSGSLSGNTEGKGLLGQELALNQRYGIADTRMTSDCSDLSRAGKENCLDEMDRGRNLYYAKYPDSYANWHGYMRSSYHHQHIQYDTLRCGLSVGSQTSMGPATSGSSQCPLYPSFPSYYPGQYIDADPDTFKPYQHNGILHHPTCSCFQCYNSHQPHNNYQDGAYIDKPSNPVVNDRNYDSRLARGPSSFHDITTRTRGTVDFYSRVGNYESLRPRRVILSKGGRRCYPLVGGAPFMTCQNCFELLQLPIKLQKSKVCLNKLQCGACSTIVYCYFRKNKLLISDELKNEGDNNELMDEGIADYAHPERETDTKFNSDNFDSSDNDFRMVDKEHVLRDRYQNLNTNKRYDATLTSDSSVSPSRTDKECSQLNPKAQRNLQISTAPPPGSSLNLDHSSSNYISNQDENRNLSTLPDREKIIQKAVVQTDHILSKEVSMATEMEVSFNGYSNSGISQDSGDGSREDQHRQINKKDGLPGIIKKSFKEIIKLDHVDDGDKISVTINGHPISDRLIKKAEKRAGRVRPGNYWYDIRAGFWGVMGGPCLGIIPPFIEEFNYPLSEDCSGGTTGVFVNGRELHDKDLELLSSRGLPTTGDRSYIIEISGRVVDADSGEELDSLGRLAKTVEKAKHGFGMKVPKELVVTEIEIEQ